MSVLVIDGSKFDGVEFGNAPGTDPGYVIGSTPLFELLRVDDKCHRADLYGLKYYHHVSGDQKRKRTKANKKYHALTMLVSSGLWYQRVWDRDTRKSVAVLLREPGDFIAWKRGLEHSWHAIHASTMLTVRWRKRKRRGK